MVGGGLVGFVLVIECWIVGFDILVIEFWEGVIDKVCGEGLMFGVFFVFE